MRRKYARRYEQRRRQRCDRGTGGGPMMRLSQAAQALGMPFAGRDVEFPAVSTDSRAVRHGDLFVALKGERFDGHEFVAQAAAAGASAAMVDAGSGIRDSAMQLPLIAVADTPLL